jgi:methionyl-tRNA formyltransferase
MTNKGYQTLHRLLTSGYGEMIDQIITARDKNVQNDYATEIKQLCQKYRLPCRDRKEKYILHSSYQIAISWRWLIKGAPKLIVLHDSILPFYRGFSPLPSYLINGEKTIGVTALFANQSYDQGDIIAIKKRKINYPLKIKTAIELIARDYAILTEKILKNIKNNQSLKSSPQNKKRGS